MAESHASLSGREPRLQPGMRVGRFVISSAVGSGGMADVYSAVDTRLNRTVALKRVGRQYVADQKHRDRVWREAERACSVSHPHVAAVYDVIEDDADVFIVMEFVVGETLRERLARPITITDAVAFTIQAAEALAAAHDHGVIHCDIKPENIMLSGAEQTVKVLDFGVARQALPDHAAESDVTVQLSGTPAYMAPEVLLEHEPDARSDIFSLGVVLYEMLAGFNPFRAETLVETAARITQTDAPPIGDVRPDVPEALQRVVMRMVARIPAARYQSAREVATALRDVPAKPGPVLVPPPASPMREVAAPPPRAKARAWALAATAMVVVLLAVALFVWTPLTKLFSARGTSPSSATRDIAVLPFAVQTESDATRAFSDGLAETLSAKLSQIGGRYAMQIVPVSEARAQNVTGADQAARALGVRYVLQGSLRQAGGSFRVTYALIDARTRRQLRGDTITASSADPFAVEDRVVDSILSSLDIALGPGERAALTSKRPAEPGAYDYYLQGLGYLQEYHKPESLQSAVAVFRRAIDLEPNYALAWAGLGEAYWAQYDQTKNTALVAKALDACSRAAKADANAAQAHICLGTVYTGSGKYEQGVDEFRHAVTQDPTNAVAYSGLGLALEKLNRTKDAEETLRAAIALRPSYWGGYNSLGAFYFRNSRVQDAAKMFARVTELAPDNFRGYSNLGAAYLAAGDYDQAITALEQSAKIRPTQASLSNLGATYFYKRRFADAIAAYKRAIAAGDAEYVVWGNLGEAYHWNGDDAQKRTNLEKALAMVRDELRVNPRDGGAVSDMAWFEAMLGDAAASRRDLKRALSLSPNDYDVLFKAGLVNAYLGDANESIAWLEKAAKAGFPVRRIVDNPAFDQFKGNPQFLAIVQTR